MLKITEEMREAAGKLLRNPALKANRPDRDLLAAMSEGKRKLIDAVWWKEIHGVVNQTKLDKLARMADPARNPNEHEREVAGHKLDEFRARRPPGLPPEPPPLPSLTEMMAARAKVQAENRERAKRAAATRAAREDRP
jgi:hypothetical protein